MGSAAPFVVTFVGKIIAGASIKTAFFVAFATYVISRAAQAMANDPSPRDSGEGRSRTFRQEAAPRVILYGENRIGGIITLIEATDANEYLHIVITLTGHEVDSIGDIYFDDQVVLTEAGVLDSKYRAFNRSGDVSVINGNTFRADQNAANPVDFDGVRIGQIIEVTGFTDPANNGPHRVVSAVIDEDIGVHTITVAETLVNEAETNVSITGDYVHISRHLGGPNQAADSGLVRMVDKWTTNHRQRGCAYLYVRIRWNKDKWPTGVPNVSAIVRGKKDIFDPRDGMTKYTDNAALCTADYLLDPNFGFGADYAEEVDDATLVASANSCDELVSLAAGGTEKRYTANGTISSGTVPIKNLESLIGAMAGDAIWSGGKWFVEAGVYKSPSLDFDEDDARGPITVTTAVSRRELFNRVKGTYIGPKNSYIKASFPAVTNSTYEAQDNGEVIWRTIDLPLTDTPSRGQRIAKIDLERIRQQISVTYPTTLKALQVRAGNTITLTNARMGWSQKPFEITDWEFAIHGDEENPTLGVDLTLRETASAVYDWNSGEETQVDPAPNTNLPDPFISNPPANLTVESGTDHLFPKKDGTIVSRLRVSWERAPDSFANEYEIQYKRSADTTYIAAGRVEQDDRELFIFDVEDGVDYDVRARAINIFRVSSDWTTVLNHTVVGKTAPPPDPDEFDVVVQADGTREFTFNLNSPPADLAGFEVRYISGSSTDFDAMQTLTPQGRLVFSPFESNQLPAGLFSFGVKAVDTSGNYSTNALYIEQQLPNPRLAGVLLQRVEKGLGWPGTITDGYVDTDGTLQSLGLTWDELTDGGGDWQWDELVDGGEDQTWYEAFANSTDLVYETPEIDLGTDAIFTPRVTVSADGTAVIEMKTGTDADGGVTGVYTALDDVEGARYVQIRVTVSGTGTALKSMTTLIDGQTEVTPREDIDTASESAAWFNRIAAGHFQIAANDDTGAITSATISAIQGITSRHWWSLESKTETVDGKPAAEFKVYDDTDTLADVTIDVELKGPKKAA